MEDIDASTVAGNEIPHYRAFWEQNLQKMEEISSRIERTLIRLEKKYLGFEESYGELTDSIDLLLSIYSSYNNLGGIEYLLRLKACLSEYRRRYGHEGIRFNVLHHLHAKVMELRNGSFAAFPRVRHRPAEKAFVPSPAPGFRATHRWVTFESNGAWFVAPYDDVEMVRSDGAEVRIDDATGHRYLAWKGVRYPVMEVMPPHTAETRKDAGWCILVHRGDTTRCYAASETGRRILARKDVIGPRLKKYERASWRYIRLFGRNHILLET